MNPVKNPEAPADAGASDCSRLMVAPFKNRHFFNIPCPYCFSNINYGLLIFPLIFFIYSK